MKSEAASADWVMRSSLCQHNEKSRLDLGITKTGDTRLIQSEGVLLSNRSPYSRMGSILGFSQYSPDFSKSYRKSGTYLSTHKSDVLILSFDDKKNLKSKLCLACYYPYAYRKKTVRIENVKFLFNYKFLDLDPKVGAVDIDN